MTSSAFSVTPVTGFPPPTVDEFPDYIQFQNHGADLGDATVTKVNFSTGTTATRGTGENSGTVTVVASGAEGSAIQFQDEGSALGGPDADTVNFAGAGVTASRSGSTVLVTIPGPGAAGQAQIQFEDEGSNLGAVGTVSAVDFTGAGVTASRATNKVTVNIPGAAAPSFTFRTYTTTTTIAALDIDNGMLFNDVSSCNCIIPSNSVVPVNPGQAVLITNKGAGVVTVTRNTGGPALNSRAGLGHNIAQYATATLINIGTDQWVLCGDLS